MDLFNAPQTWSSQFAWYSVPLLALVASFLGSTHCLGMCGGIVITLRPRLSHLGSYHLGRLIGYLSLGAIAGFAGEQLLTQTQVLSWVAAGLLGLTFIWMGLKIWRGEEMALRLPSKIEGQVQRIMGKSLKTAKDKPLSGLMVGLCSVFLPCGWLYTFILGAVATQNLVLGMVFLGAFWAGTLPALSLAPLIIQKWLPKLPATPRKVSSSLLVLAGGLTLYFKLGPLMHTAAHSAGMTCH